MDDVVVIDPSDSCPVGFNPLAFPGYENPPLIADAVLSVLKELWADNWGVRIQDVLSAALLTLVEVNGASLLWLPAFLTDEQFRQRITKNIKMCIRDRFNVVIRLGASGKDAEYHVNSILSALQTLEAAGVKIRAEAEPADRLNNVHLPKHILLRLSVKELGSFLLLPAGEEPLPGTPELHPRELPPPKWYYPVSYTHLDVYKRQTRS